MSMKPTILQVLPELVSGGVERGSVEIARALSDAQWGNLVASAGGPMEQSLAYAGATHFKLPMHSKHPLKIYANARHLERIIQEYNVSVIHARSRAPAWSAYLAAKRTGIPFLTTFHGFYGLNGPFKKTYNSVMVRGAKVIAISCFIRDHILEHYPICPAQRIEVIHRGADINTFSPDAVTPGRLAELSEQWRIIDSHSPVIMMPGRLTRWKGHHVFIEALKLIKNNDFVALLVGDDGGHPNYRHEIEQQIEQSGLSGRVRFVGKTSHMTEAYALSDIVVNASIEPEAFGRVPVEAQAMGKIIVATKHGGALETVIDGKTGFLVAPDNAAEMARALRHALELTPAGRSTIGAWAMQHVRTEFSIEQMQQKTLAVYASLL